jgi:hypothetical protein
MKNPANERDFVGAQLVPYGGTGSNRGPSRLRRDCSEPTIFLMTQYMCEISLT